MIAGRLEVVTADVLSRRREGLDHQRYAIAVLRRAVVAVPEETIAFAERLASSQVAVEVACVVCPKKALVAVTVGDYASGIPRGVLCAACDEETMRAVRSDEGGSS